MPHMSSEPKLKTCRESRGVIIVDDHPLFRHGMVQLLERDPDMAVLGEASDGASAVELARKTEPTVALIDISMPGRNGIELIKSLKAEFPALRMIAVSMHDEMLYAVRALRAGALGYIRKTEPLSRIHEAIRVIADGHVFVTDELGRHLVTFAIEHLDTEGNPGVESLSDREREVLEHYGRGLTTSEICRTLNIGSKTIETYRTRLKAKLRLSDMAELVQFAEAWMQRDE